MQTTWIPELGRDHAQPLYEQLIGALARDVERGDLKPGERLPPQRDLAYALKLSLGTVTRAYAEAERRGLITGHVGRGSFVADRAAPRAIRAGAPVDLARNLPPLAPAARRYPAALAAAARRGDLAELMDYPPAGGFPEQRRAMAAWLKRMAGYETADAERLILTAGAQQATAVALASICRPGAAVIAEEASFAGIKTLAAHMDYRLIPAAMDAEGLTPQALERAARESGARVAYVLPVQNPTARVMGAARRAAIIETARRLDLYIVEDDLYAPYAAHLGHPPLALLAPERVAYVGGLSKSLAPGLRIGWVIPPAGREAAALDALRAVAFTPPTLTGHIAARWIETGEAFEIFEEVRAETAARTAMAREQLGDNLEASPLEASPHLWLPMDELAAERLAGRLLRAGVEITPPRAVTLEGAPVRGVRLCLGGVADRAQLSEALAVVKTALGAPVGGGTVV